MPKLDFSNRWNEYNNLRKKFSDNFYSIPVVFGDEKSIALDFIPNGCSLLDVGANDRKFFSYLQGKRVRYYSMDIDRSLSHDFYSLDEIKKKRFDVVTLFNVLEHLNRKECEQYLSVFSTITDKVILTIPNIFGPVYVFYQDDTHKSQYGYRTISALLSLYGFTKAQVIRLSGSRHIFLKSIISRFTQMDFCHNVMVVAEKTI